MKTKDLKSRPQPGRVPQKTRQQNLSQSQSNQISKVQK